MARYVSFRLCLLGLAACLTPAIAARASDGVVEINQARAEVGGIAPGDAPGFPVTISVPGSYRLTGSLVVADPAKSALEVTAPHVAIDLNGFSITGPTVCTVSNFTGATTGCAPPGAGAGVSGFSDDISVAGGTIRGLGGFGIQLGSSVRVERMKVLANGAGGIVAIDGVIERNVVTHNGGTGIVVGGVIRDNVVGGNLGVGIMSSGVVSGNSVLANGGGGASLNPLAAFSGNQFVLNAGSSVVGGRATGGNMCDDNRCRDGRGRRFYLTKTIHSGLGPTTACATGFHFASFSELQANGLEYDTTLGKTLADSGQGAPRSANGPGWARSGIDAAESFNCDGWTSFAATSRGLLYRLEICGYPLGSCPAPSWITGSATCDSFVGVWCVQD